MTAKRVAVRSGKPVNVTIDPEAHAILRRYCPDGKRSGKFVSRVIFEFAAREDERRRLQQAEASDSCHT